MRASWLAQQVELTVQRTAIAADMLAGGGLRKLARLGWGAGRFRHGWQPVRTAIPRKVWARQARPKQLSSPSRWRPFSTGWHLACHPRPDSGAFGSSCTSIRVAEGQGEESVSGNNERRCNVRAAVKVTSGTIRRCCAGEQTRAIFGDGS